MLSTKSEFKSDPVEKQNINFNKTFLSKNVLNLAGTPQDINSIEMLSIKNKSYNKYSGSISDSISYNQMRIPHLGLTFITKRSSDQAERV